MTTSIKPYITWCIFTALAVLQLCGAVHATPETVAEHPRLAMTPADVTNIRARLGQVPLFDASLAVVRTEVDAEIARGIETPVPKDYSGGYTHERHKKNYAIAQKAGALYQILGEEKYARYVRSMLLQYAAMYPGLPLHPKERSYARGKIFWQCLNDANWLVFMAQAYDAIHAYLSAEERAKLEHDLFRPFADHLSVGSPQFFNRVHNHSTWGTAAVGMIGLVMQDDALVQRALYGLDLNNFSDARDDDGGFIRQAGQKAGFFANLDSAFSPDGYYTEGPYYQRYAMYPYLVFAQSLRNADYREQAFERNDGVLLKAVDTLIQLSDADGEFFPLNDAQKGMSLQANELVTAVDIAYQVSAKPQLLGIASAQQRVLLDGAGFAVATAISQGKAEPMPKTSQHFSDGRTGNEGGLALLRTNNEALTVLFKYTAQGLSHGHYDKLSYSLYEQGNEILQDYGMVRFVNIEQKGGGNYLPENTTWAKQTVAHNTLVVNERSHFQGEYQTGSQHHSELDFFTAADPSTQVVSAYEHHAYPGTRMHRTLALVHIADKPLLLDILDVSSNALNQYDLPFHYAGHIIDANFAYTAVKRPSVLGKAHGYQHLYLEARGHAEDVAQLTWLNKGRFFTLTTTTTPSDELLFTRLGANDPNFNLRRDPAFILRRKKSGNTVFVSVIEPHGSYSPVTELAVNSTSAIADLRVDLVTPEYLAIGLSSTSGHQARFLLSRLQLDQAPRRQSGGVRAEATKHRLQIGDETFTWKGPFQFTVQDNP